MSSNKPKTTVRWFLAFYWHCKRLFGGEDYNAKQVFEACLVIIHEILDSAPLKLHFQEAVNEVVEGPIHDLLDIAFFDSGPVILHQGIRHEGVGADLGSPFDGFLITSQVRDLGFLSFDLDLIEFTLQHIHGILTIVQL